MTSISTCRASGSQIKCPHLPDTVDDIERVAAVGVELVDKGYDRHVAQPTDLEDLAGLPTDSSGKTRLRYTWFADVGADVQICISCESAKAVAASVSD